MAPGHQVDRDRGAGGAGQRSGRGKRPNLRAEEGDAGAGGHPTGKGAEPRDGDSGRRGAEGDRGGAAAAHHKAHQHPKDHLAAYAVSLVSMLEPKGWDHQRKPKNPGVRRARRRRRRVAGAGAAASGGGGGGGGAAAAAAAAGVAAPALGMGHGDAMPPGVAAGSLESPLYLSDSDSGSSYDSYSSDPTGSPADPGEGGVAHWGSPVLAPTSVSPGSTALAASTALAGGPRGPRVPRNSGTALVPVPRLALPQAGTRGGGGGGGVGPGVLPHTASVVDANTSVAMGVPTSSGDFDFCVLCGATGPCQCDELLV